MRGTVRIGRLAGVQVEVHWNPRSRCSPTDTWSARSPCGGSRRVPAGRRTLITAREIACPIDEVPTATAHTPLSDLIPRLNAGPDGRALVLQDGRLVGVVSPSDVSRAIEHGTLHSIPSHESTRART